MAAAMNQTMQTCSQMALMTQTQMVDEDKVDPFPAKTTVELEEMLEACRRTKEILARESLIYSKSADFSKYTDTELLAMNAFVKENSRTLSIILAGGSTHFFEGKATSTLTELRNMYQYIDEKVGDFLMLDKIMETLEYKVRYGKKMSTSKSVMLQAHPDLSEFTLNETTKGATSQESLVRLAEVCEKFAVQCRAIAKRRVEKMDDRARKIERREQLLREIDTVIPFLRQHVLRVGLGKAIMQETNPAKNGSGPGTHAHKITTLFSHKAVEEVHRTVEDCRERLLQETLFRRAKVERRLAKEEEDEKKMGSAAGAKVKGQLLSDMPAYKSVMADNQPRGRPEVQRPGTSPLSRSPSPKGKAGSPRATTGSPTTSPRSPGGRSPSPEKEASPKKAARDGSPKAKAQSKGGTKADAGSKAAAKGKAAPKAKASADSRESSPAKSPGAKAKGKPR